jgi:hypothetical protein
MAISTLFSVFDRTDAKDNASQKRRRTIFMPRELENKLKKEAASKGYSDEKADAYVYGTMRKTGWKPKREQHGSLEDITFHEEAAQRDTVMDGETVAHPIHKGYDSVVFGDIEGWPEDGDEPKGSTMSANRDNGYGVHYGAPVDYFGPDTDYRAEEIDMTQYGKDYDPIPLRDYFKTEDKMYERTFRVRAKISMMRPQRPVR